MALFSINGYWNDDKTPFENYIVTDHHSSPEGCNEDEIFFYGLSEDDIKNCILNGSGSLDFTITEYKKITYKFPRVCSITGEGMWEGYCFNEGESYAKDEESAKKIAVEYGHDGLWDSYQVGDHYFTMWNELDEDGWYESEHEDGRDAVWVSADGELPSVTIEFGSIVYEFNPSERDEWQSDGDYDYHYDLDDNRVSVYKVNDGDTDTSKVLYTKRIIF